MSARDMSALLPCWLVLPLPANKGTLETDRICGQLGTRDSQELWTGRNCGQPGTSNRQELWTARNFGQPGTRDKQGLWTGRN